MTDHEAIIERLDRILAILERATGGDAKDPLVDMIGANGGLAASIDSRLAKLEEKLKTLD